MVAWDYRNADNWASLLGIVKVPLFGMRQQADAAGEHFVLLDGRRSSLTLSRGNADALLVSGRPIEWAWSANIPRAIVTDDRSNTIYGVRWDRPDDVRTLSGIAPEAVTRFLTDLEVPAAIDVESSVSRALGVFRSVRLEVRAFGGDDLDATHAFNVLLILSDYLRHSRIEKPPRFLPDIVIALSSANYPLLSSHSFSPSLDALPIGDMAAQLIGMEGGRPLNPYLLIRHASGTLFQEAHISLRQPPNVDPKLFISLHREIRRPSGQSQADAHYTPTAMARFLTEQAIGEYRRVNPGTESITVLDPACGTNILRPSLTN